MKTIDLRSDTVTLPSPNMREAMHLAELGDDGYGEDPTVIKLQEIASEMVGKEATLLVPSGCMANLIALLTHCGRQGEAILGYSTDMYIWECGAMSALGSIYPHPLQNNADGTINLADIEDAIRFEDMHFPRTQLICLENSNNICGGVPLTPEYIASVSALARRHSLPVYLDGARIFNAAVALGIDVKELTKDVDTLMFCLSKGLSCPIGSMICGSRDFIAEAKRNRKLLGGQMRQAGVIAAAGIIGLKQMVDRLADDHQNAKYLHERLMEIRTLSLKPDIVRTNIVYFKLVNNHVPADSLVAMLEREGLKVLLMGHWIRAVTHYGIEKPDIEKAIAIIKQVVENC